MQYTHIGYGVVGPAQQALGQGSGRIQGVRIWLENFTGLNRKAPEMVRFVVADVVAPRDTTDVCAVKDSSMLRVFPNQSTTT